MLDKKNQQADCIRVHRSALTLHVTSGLPSLGLCDPESCDVKGQASCVVYLPLWHSEVHAAGRGWHATQTLI